MVFVFFRLMLRLFAFFFLFFFIVFHFVLGYIYQSDVGFIKSDNFFVFYKRSDKKETIKVNGNSVSMLSNQLVFFNVNRGCYNINFRKGTYNICLSGKDFVKLPVVYVKRVKLFSGGFVYKCDSKDSSSKFFDKVRKVMCKDFLFVEYHNKLFVCDENERICYKLGNFSGHIVGYNDNGLILFSGNKLYTLFLN